MKIFITGGCGFLGSNLSAYAIKKNYDLVILDNLSRYGSSENLDWLKNQGKFKFINEDIRNKEVVNESLKSFEPDIIFHLAGQVAMTTSLKDPYMDFETNVGGSLNVLEAVRVNDLHAAIFYSSTNKVYGDLEQFKYSENETRFICDDHPNGFSEEITLDFHSPYGCSKGSADQYMLDYARLFGLKTVVFRHSSMYGGRQFATSDQGWVGWFCQKGLEAKKTDENFSISGTGKQVRDVLHADDMVNLYFSSINFIDKISGNAFNVGGGIYNSLSLLELFDLIERRLNVKMKYEKLPPRESDQKIFVADFSKLNNITGWKPEVSKKHGIWEMISWLQKI